ncbi:MAG: hypothetical protein K9K79_11820, partial [Desulfohalobiaceae bacterium]|nr:hypothetical protein [Desulfohalobiaceae bacterium]
MLGYWDAGMLGCWDAGMLGCWDVAAAKYPFAAASGQRSVNPKNYRNKKSLEAFTQNFLQMRLTSSIWIPASAGMTEGVTKSFFFDQTGRLRPEAGLT